MVPVPSSSYVGSAISIAGNILVAFALNTQKLAHQRLSAINEDGPTNSPKPNERERLLRPTLPKKSKRDRADYQVYTVAPNTNEITGQVPHPKKTIRELAKDGTQVQYMDERTGRMRKKWLAIRSSSRDRAGQDSIQQTGSGTQASQGRDRTDSKGSSTLARPKTARTRSRRKEPQGSVYQSKLWWLGLTLMALGELGNFTSYAFAPASIVAPLGTTALIANCFIAPCLLHERFRKQDLIGIALSILGAVGVVLSGKSENKSLSPRQFLNAISQLAFIVYSAITLGLIIFLMLLSRTKAGDKYLAVDILITALCGGFTVLSTKAFSSFLTKGFLDCFKEPITYAILAVLASTAVLQIIYLNKALGRFESRVVVPTQFVSFTISAITGSAILYRDFENVDAGSVAEFFGGCVAVFVGVVILTRSKSPSSGSNDAERNQDTNGEVVDGNESNISDSTTGGTGLDGVTLTSEPPNGRLETPNVLSRARQPLRKHSSFGTFPIFRPGTSTSAFGAAVATPVRTGRPPSLATAKMFSPGYLLIAGSGFGALQRQESSSSSDAEGSTGERDGDSIREESGEDGQDGQDEQERLMEGVGETEGDPDQGMTSSQVMKRSGTI